MSADTNKGWLLSDILKWFALADFTLGERHGKDLRVTSNKKLDEMWLIAMELLENDKLC